MFQSLALFLKKNCVQKLKLKCLETKIAKFLFDFIFLCPTQIFLSSILVLRVRSKFGKLYITFSDRYIMFSFSLNLQGLEKLVKTCKIGKNLQNQPKCDRNMFSIVYSLQKNQLSDYSFIFSRGLCKNTVLLFSFFFPNTEEKIKQIFFLDISISVSEHVWKPSLKKVWL